MSFLPESGNYNIIGSYWEKGNQNEITTKWLVNDLKEETYCCGNQDEQGEDQPGCPEKEKEINFWKSYQGYEVTWLALGLEDAADYL